MPGALLQPEQRVLSTLNADGSRRWLKPRLARGRFLRARRAVAWLLIAVFTALPHVFINGKPALLLDILHREFTFFGKTFLPIDTLVAMLLLLAIFLTVFLMTALLGRVWCGWACPQTVYMEFVFRPLDRLFDGEPGRPAPSANTGLRKVLKHVAFVLVSVFLANTFLSYFVGRDALVEWVQRSPIDHPVPFLVMLAVSGLMLFDFGYFREQVCIVACPYGRMQSVMLDQDSLIVTYDRARGEPRGKATGSRRSNDVSLKIVAEETGAARFGDCVDCNLCVAVCPTGIDIRKGLQMECIGCAQCVDACDSVMGKLKRPLGLIRYSTQSSLSGERHLLRARVVIYPLILCVVIGGLVWRIATAATADISLVRGRGLPFNTLPDGQISNQATIKITNRSGRSAQYTISIAAPFDGDGFKVVAADNPLTVAPGEIRDERILITAPISALRDGRRDIAVRVTDDAKFDEQVTWRIVGPTRETKPDTRHRHEGPQEGEHGHD